MIIKIKYDVIKKLLGLDKIKDINPVKLDVGLVDDDIEIVCDNPGESFTIKDIKKNESIADIIKEQFVNSAEV